ncbi:MAG: polysaccharide deacetylase family protein [Deltaproteobacteria bacterium]|nr:polysaccharide deacetylase family protein [Deltaproteobacteria bacterium]
MVNEIAQRRAVLASLAFSTALLAVGLVWARAATGAARPDATKQASTGSATRAAAGVAQATKAPPASPSSPSIAGDRDATLSRMARGKVITGATSQRILLFTFDDGPHVGTTPRLLDILDREGIKALFFVVAHRIRTTGRVHQQQRDILRDIVRRGHWVANHSVNHRILPGLDPTQAAFEMNEAARLIELVTGARPWVFRPPGGGRSARIDRMLESAGYTIMMWNLGTGDPFVRTAREVRHTFGRVLERRARMGSRGGIILLHDTHGWSVDAVPMIVADVRRRNCELLASGDRELYVFLDDPTAFFVARAEGDRPGADAPAAALPAAQYDALQTRERQRAEQYCVSAAASSPLNPSPCLSPRCGEWRRASMDRTARTAGTSTSARPAGASE